MSEARDGAPARRFEVLVPYIDPDVRAESSEGGLIYEVWAADAEHARRYARERFREFQVRHRRARVASRGPTIVDGEARDGEPAVIPVRLTPGAFAALLEFQRWFGARLEEAGKTPLDAEGRPRRVPLADLAGYLLEHALHPRAGSPRLEPPRV